MNNLKRLSLAVVAMAVVTSSPGVGFRAQAMPVPKQLESPVKGQSFMPANPQLPPIGSDEAKRAGLQYLLSQRTTNFRHASDSQALNMKLLAKRLNGVLLQPGQVFSYYKIVGPYTAENGYHWGRAFQGNRIVPSMGGGVCQGASTLYSALLRTDLKVIERHPHSLMVPYLPPGEDATVADTYLNFRFKNTEDKPIFIAAGADLKKKLLTVAVWGATPPAPVRVHHKILEVYPFQTIRQKTSTLPVGQTKVIAPGQSGVKAHTWIEHRSGDGWKIIDLGVDTYRASPRIIQAGAEA